MQFDRADCAAFAAMLEEIDQDTVVLDVMEFITIEDTRRMEELGITEEDMPDGYYIYIIRIRRQPALSWASIRCTDSLIGEGILWILTNLTT